MMKCPACKADIDPDSNFCDQCRQELKLCPKCHIFGKSKRCTQCGGKLIDPADKPPMIDPSEMPAGKTSPDAAKDKPKPIAPPKPEPVDKGKTSTRTGGGPFGAEETNAGDKTIRIANVPKNKAFGIPDLYFTNKNIGANIKFNDGDIIGRKNGPHTRIFGQYGQVSGTHARINFSNESGWQITDMDSSNGTRYNNEYLKPNIPQIIENESYIIIANIEFYVRIE